MGQKWAQPSQAHIGTAPRTRCAIGRQTSRCRNIKVLAWFIGIFRGRCSCELSFKTASAAGNRTPIPCDCRGTTLTIKVISSRQRVGESKARMRSVRPRGYDAPGRKYPLIANILAPSESSRTWDTSATTSAALPHAPALGATLPPGNGN